MKTKLTCPVFGKGLFIALSFLAFATVTAQTIEEGPRIGLKVGIDGARFHEDANAEERDRRIGFIGGVFVKVPIGNRLALRPELLYAMKGGKYDYRSNTRSEIKLGYVELPFSLELKLLGFLNLHGGFHAAYLVDATGIVVDLQGNGFRIDFNENDFERIDYGWHVGTGFDFGNVGVHLRLSQGLNSLGRSKLLEEYIGSLKNSAWELSFSMAL